MKGPKSMLNIILEYKEDRYIRLGVSIFKDEEGRISIHHLVVTEIRHLRRLIGKMVKIEESMK